MNINTGLRNTLIAFTNVRERIREHEIGMCMRQVTNVSLSREQRERAHARLMQLISMREQQFAR